MTPQVLVLHLPIPRLSRAHVQMPIHMPLTMLHLPMQLHPFPDQVLRLSFVLLHSVAGQSGEKRKRFVEAVPRISNSKLGVGCFISIYWK